MLGLVVAMMLQAGEPAAEPAPASPRPKVVTNPDWLRRPTGEDLARLYPKAALEMGLSGRATISCTVTEEGALADCQVPFEDPKGAGFGDAVLALSTKFRMKPMTVDGQPVRGGTVRIPIRFMLPGPTYPPIEITKRCYGLTAAVAEVTPTQDTWKTTMVWRTLTSLLMAQKGERPSKVDEVLQDALAKGIKDSAHRSEIATEWDRCGILVQSLLPAATSPAAAPSPSPLR